jgi:activator of HSP90 ATPase
MRTESFEVTAFFSGVNAEHLYRAWLDSAEHSAFTGSPAQVDPHAGGRFTAWDGYIYGKTLELQPFRLIVQAWRTTEFPAQAPDSRLEVWLEDKEGGVQMRLVHSEIPEGQGDEYRLGWEEYYFIPMREYFPGK